jgi:hypothetical protein
MDPLESPARPSEEVENGQSEVDGMVDGDDDQPQHTTSKKKQPARSGGTVVKYTGPSEVVENGQNEVDGMDDGDDDQPPRTSKKKQPARSRPVVKYTGPSHPKKETRPKKGKKASHSTSNNTVSRPNKLVLDIIYARPHYVNAAKVVRVVPRKAQVSQRLLWNSSSCNWTKISQSHLTDSLGLLKPSVLQFRSVLFEYQFKYVDPSIPYRRFPYQRKRG